MGYTEGNGQTLLAFKNLKRSLNTSRMSPISAEDHNEQEHPTTAEDILKGSVDPMLIRLTSALCASYPQYDFQLAPRAGYISAPCHSIIAWEGGLKLGSIDVHAYRYELTNERIQKKLRRSTSKKTGSLDTALAIFKREFKPPSEVEKLEAANESIRQTFRRSRANSAHRLKGVIPDAVDKRTLKQESFDLLLKVLELEGVPEADLAMLAREYEAGKAIDAITYPKPVGLVVSIGSDGNYYTQSYNNRACDGHLVSLPVDSYTPESLPDALRSDIGLLKLIEDKSFLENVGYKLNNTSFFVRANYESIR